MWLWSIVSLIILIACTIFAYRMIVSSYEFLPADKRFFPGFHKGTIFSSGNFVQKDTNTILKTKVLDLDNSTFYEIQFSKLQQRLKTLEDQYTFKSLQAAATLASKEEEEKEDWKELYYEENSAKEKLENELDFTKQAIEMAENKFKEFEEKTNSWKELQSDYEMRLNDLQSLQNNIDLLQRKLEASIEREKELEQLLLSEITMREKYSLLQQEYTQLLSERDNLKRRNVEMTIKM